MVDTYADIAEEAFGQFLSEKTNPVLRPLWHDDAIVHYEQESRRTVTGLKIIVFTAMAIEAAAYKFSTIQLADHPAKSCLDKLD